MVVERDRIEQILAECKDNLDGFGSIPSRMDDGPGAVSAMYTSFSFREIKEICERALNQPSEAGESSNTTAQDVMDLVQRALELAPSAGLYLKIQVEEAK